jgi:hypothetical protein
MAAGRKQQAGSSGQEAVGRWQPADGRKKQSISKGKK